MNWIMKRPLLVGLALILSANFAVWASAYWNRSSIESTLILSERELQPTGYDRDPTADRRRTDNNAIEFAMRVSNQYSYRVPPEAMETLGFKELMEAIIKREEDIYNSNHFPEQTALIVLELDGPAYHAEIAKKAEELAKITAQKFKNSEERESALQYPTEKLQTLETKDSRLYIVDVGRDLETLRAAYPDRSRYAIVHGTIDPIFGRVSNESYSPDNNEPYDLSGRVSNLMSPYIQLPLEWHDTPIYKRDAKFQTTVNFGRRLEPWISDLKAAAGVDNPAENVEE